MAEGVKIISKPPVSREERKLNEVDLLLNRVKKIRTECAHDFRLFVPHNLPESLVKGIYQAHYNQSFEFRCLKCSKEGQATIPEICVNCFSRSIAPAGKSEELSKYFNKNRIESPGITCFSARVHRCEECGFTIVAPSAF